MYPCDGCYDVQTVCELFLGDAQGAYRGVPELFRLSWVHQ
jgi:hypothetical protein